MNFPFIMLDMEVYGKNGYLQAVDNNHIREKKRNTSYIEIQPSPIQAQYEDNISYLKALLKQGFRPSADHASLKNNLAVMQILDAAKSFAKQRKRIILKIKQRKIYKLPRQKL